MAVYKRGDTWWYSFIFCGKRIQESTKTSSKTIAKKAEENRRRELEKTLAGIPIEARTSRILSVSDVVVPYLEKYKVNHREKSILFAEGRLEHVQRYLGKTLLPDLNSDKITAYIKHRQAQKVSGRTINMELGELSRAIGKPWSILWPSIRKLEERKDIGRALSFDEESRLLHAVDGMHSPIMKPFVHIALLTGMRSNEILTLTWDQVDLEDRVITVGRAKTSSGTGRQIPFGDELFDVVTSHREWFVERFGEPESDHYLFPWGKPTPSDPTRPITTLKTSWKTLRTTSKVQCLSGDNYFSLPTTTISPYRRQLQPLQGSIDSLH